MKGRRPKSEGRGPDCLLDMDLAGGGDSATHGTLEVLVRLLELGLPSGFGFRVSGFGRSPLAARRPTIVRRH